jgi:membrane protein implicated in regulation of membrane protease activity
MSWWMWVLLGVVLLAVEIVTPGGLFALFFGASAILVGGLVALGVEARWLQWLLFAGLGVVLVGALRRRLRPRMAGDPAVDGLVGELAIPQEDLAPGATGRADLRGAPWTAINDGGTTLRGGQRCRVSRAENLTIYIRAE